MKYILTIDDDEALCKLVKKCIETEQVPVYTCLLYTSDAADE